MADFWIYFVSRDLKHHEKIVHFEETGQSVLQCSKCTAVFRSKHFLNKENKLLIWTFPISFFFKKTFSENRGKNMNITRFINLSLGWGVWKAQIIKILRIIEKGKIHKIYFNIEPFYLYNSKVFLKTWKSSLFKTTLLLRLFFCGSTKYNKDLACLHHQYRS